MKILPAEKYQRKTIEELLFEIYKRCYQSVIKKYTIFSIILYLINYQFVYRTKNLFLTIYLLEGFEKHGKEKITTLYIGNRESLFYICNILFSEDPEIKILDKISIWGIKNGIKRYKKNIDFIILNTDRFFSNYLQKKGFFVIPEWVGLNLDITSSLDDIIKNFKKSAKEDINKINKEGYIYEISNEIEKFNHFFYRIRQPSFSKRIGKQALPGSESYHDLKISFQNGFLFLVKKNEEYLSGFIVILRKKRAEPHFMGIIEKPYLEEGAGSALFYLFIKWAKEKGIKILNFGNTRSFLNEGAFQFKRKWNMALQIGGFKSIFAFHINNKNCKAIYDFFENNPFVYIQDKCIKGFVFTNKKVDRKFILDNFKKYYTPGMKELYIITSKESLQKIISGDYDGSIITVTPENLNKLPIETTNNDLKDENDQVKQIMRNEYKDMFQRIIKRFPLLKNVVSRTLTITFSRLKNEGLPIEKINEKVLLEVFSALDENKFSKEAVPIILEYLLENEKTDVNEAIDYLGLNIFKSSNLEEVISKIVNDRKEFIKDHGWDSFNPLMGAVMKELQGKADGKLVSKILKNKIKEIL